MFVEDLYDFTIFLRNQGQSRWFPPEEVIAALNRAQIDEYNQEFKKFEVNSEVTDALQPFKKDDIITKDNGKFSLPVDYYHYTNISSITKDGEDITGEYPAAGIVPDDEWLEWKRTDGLLTPAIKYPVFRIAGGNVDHLPDILAHIRLYYLRSVKKAVYAYLIENGGVVFKEEGSEDPLFPETEHNFLIVQTLKYLGVPLRDELLMAFGKIQTLTTDS